MRAAGVCIAPVIEVVGEEIDTHAQLGGTFQLRLVCELAMLQCVAVICSWKLVQHLRHHIEHDLRGFIAIGVDV